MVSYPVKTNDAIHALLSIKEFCLLKGIPTILQSDNGGEYKKNFMKKIKLNKSSVPPIILQQMMLLKLVTKK